MNCYFMSFKIGHKYFTVSTSKFPVVQSSEKNSTKNKFSRLLTKTYFLLNFFLFLVFVVTTGTTQVTHALGHLFLPRSRKLTFCRIFEKSCFPWVQSTCPKRRQRSFQKTQFSALETIDLFQKSL